MVKRSHPRGSRRPEPGPESDEYLQSIESDDQCSEDGSGDEGLQLGADGVDGGDMVDADFEFYDPADGDVRGIRAMLQSLMDGAAFDVSELVDVIIHQKTVGSVVKTGQESDPVGVISVLNIQRYSSLGCIAELKGFILSHCPGQGGEKEQLSQVLSSPHTGLLINERLLNSPPELGPPLQQALFDEIQWATEDEPTQELRESFKFQQYVSLTRVFRDPKADAPSSGTDAVATKKRRRTKQEAGPLCTAGFIYIRPEDEFFHQVSNLWFTFPVEKAGSNLQQFRLVMVINANKVPQARAALDSVIGNAAAAAAALHQA